MLAEYEPIKSLPQKSYKKIIDSIYTVYLKTGEIISDIGTLPNGILFIKKGKIRISSEDDSKSLFTLKIYEEGEIVGVEEILRGSKAQRISASTEVEADFLDNENFLNLIISDRKFREYFNKFSFIINYMFN